MFSSSRSKPKRVKRRLLNLLAERHSRAAGQTVASIKNAPLTAGLMSLVIGVAMSLPALLVLISVNLQTQLEKVEDMAEVAAYFFKDVPD